MRTLEELLFGPAPVDVNDQADRAGIARRVCLTENAHNILTSCADGIPNLLTVLRQAMDARRDLCLSPVPVGGIYLMVYLPGCHPPVQSFVARQVHGAILISRAGECS
jgi:hypothetical protein